MAILLDVSNSMDGLIYQAKNQLWNTVITIGKLRCGEKPADFEIALYEYGRSDNDSANGYIRMICSFTKDLDLLNQKLSGLTTKGGDEYCGRVLYNSLTQLPWDSGSSAYKTIFIAGNESFLQGSYRYVNACELAVQKGVIVNTIFCGTRTKGIQENWDLSNNCGNGSFSWIDQDAQEFWVPTPYDTNLIVLKNKFNETYIPYGSGGLAFYEQMKGYDTVAVSNVYDPNRIVSYIVTKADPLLYNNARWDLVDAYEKDSIILEKIDTKTLDSVLQQKTKEELKQYVLQLTLKRNDIRREIMETEQKQSQFISEARDKSGLGKEVYTLKNQVQRIITEQALRFNMQIKE